jgi:tetraacyldisaccharide 4'-kinase
MSAWLAPASALVAAAWECRRRAYAGGLLRPRRAAARVVSIGNLTVGGTGKTTLTLHLAERLRARDEAFAVVCRRYLPGPAGEGDEERMYAQALGRERVFAGQVKWREAERAAAAGARTVIVDDGFSHWALARDLEVVLLDAGDPWGGGALLPRGRLREPIRALQRADLVVVSRVADAAAADAAIAACRTAAPAACWAAGRHALTAVTRLDGSEVAAAGAAHVVTATGNPEAVARSAREAGFAPVTLARYRDHHWFRDHEMRRELLRAGAGTLVLTAKDAVRWPLADPRVRVLGVRWQWVRGGELAERLLCEGRA